MPKYYKLSDENLDKKPISLNAFKIYEKDKGDFEVYDLPLKSFIISRGEREMSFTADEIAEIVKFHQTQQYTWIESAKNIIVPMDAEPFQKKN